MTGVRPRRWFFDAWSRVYDVAWVQRRTYRPLHDGVLELLDGRRPRRVLDLGCGTGQLAARLVEAHPRTRVVGCDFSAGMLAQAAGRCPRASWVQGDAGRLPFADQSFDVVVSTEAFHWFPDQRAALAECFRVLRPGGQLLIAMVNTPAVPVSEAFQLASWLVGEPFYWPSRAETRALIGAAGFRIDAQRSIARFGAPLLAPILTAATRPAPVARAAPPRRRTRSLRGGGDRRAGGRALRATRAARRARAGAGGTTTHGDRAHPDAQR